MAAPQESVVVEVLAADEEKKEVEYDNADGFDNYLFRSILGANKGASNVVLSPFSVLSAMSICMLGASNNTLGVPRRPTK